MIGISKVWLVMTLLMISFVLSGCKEGEKTASNETQIFKSTKEKEPKKPKNLTKELEKLGFNVEFKNDSKKTFFGVNKETKDEWAVQYVSAADRLYWKLLQDIDPTGYAGFAYTAYYYGDDPYGAFFGESDDITDGIIPSGVIQGLEKITGARYFEGVESLQRINEVKDIVKNNADKAESVKKGYEWVEAVTDYFTEGTEFAKGNKKDKVPPAIKTMNILNYSVIAGAGNVPLGTYEWAFLNRPIKDPEFFQFEAEAVYYPKTMDLNSVMVERIADYMYIYEGSKLVEYEGVPKINIATDGGGEQGKGVKTIIEWLLYDIYQVLDGKEPVYQTGEYAKKLVEDYKNRMNEYKVNTMLQKSRDLLLLQDYNGAIKGYDEILALVPKNNEAVMGKATALLGLDKEDESEKIMTQLIKKLQEENKDIEISGIVYDKSFIDVNLNSKVFYDIAYILYINEEYERSLYYIDKAIETIPEVEFYIIKAYDLAKIGECQKAREALDKAKELVGFLVEKSSYETLIIEAEKKIEDDKSIVCIDNEVEEEPEVDTGDNTPPPNEEATPQEIVISYQITTDEQVTADIERNSTIVLKVGDRLRIKRVDNLDRDKYYNRVLYSYGPLVSKDVDGVAADRYDFVIVAEEPGTSDIKILPPGLNESENQYLINVVVE